MISSPLTARTRRTRALAFCVACFVPLIAVGSAGAACSTPAGGKVLSSSASMRVFEVGDDMSACDLNADVVETIFDGTVDSDDSDGFTESSTFDFVGATAHRIGYTTNESNSEGESTDSYWLADVRTDKSQEVFGVAKTPYGLAWASTAGKGYKIFWSARTSDTVKTLYTAKEGQLSYGDVRYKKGRVFFSELEKKTKSVKAPTH